MWKKSRIVYGFLVVHIIQINCRLYPAFKKIDSYSNKYEDILIIGDFNIDIQELSLHLFCNQYKTYHYLILWGTWAVETCFSDFYKLVVTVLNEKHKRMTQKIIQCRDYKKFDYAIFNNNLRKTKTKKWNFSELDFMKLDSWKF